MNGVWFGLTCQCLILVLTSCFLSLFGSEAQHALMSEEDEQACRDVGNTPWYNPRTRKAECTSDPIPARGVVQRLYQREV